MAITLWFRIGSSSFRTPMIGGTLVLWPGQDKRRITAMEVIRLRRLCRALLLDLYNIYK